MTEYAKGFDHGCDYIIAEIEKWIKENNEEPYDIRPVDRLLAHLKMEKPDARETT
jgi:hypothetical protein